MTWEAVAAIGQVAGAVGVIGSLLYLAAQVRHNTRAVRGAASDAVNVNLRGSLEANAKRTTG